MVENEEMRRGPFLRDRRHLLRVGGEKRRERDVLHAAVEPLLQIARQELRDVHVVHVKLVAAAIGVIHGPRGLHVRQKQELIRRVKPRRQFRERAETRLDPPVGVLARDGIRERLHVFVEIAAVDLWLIAVFDAAIVLGLLQDGVVPDDGDPTIGVILKDIVIAQPKKVVTAALIPENGLLGERAAVRPERVAMEIALVPAFTGGARHATHPAAGQGGKCRPRAKEPPSRHAHVFSPLIIHHQIIITPSTLPPLHSSTFPPLHLSTSHRPIPFSFRGNSR